MMETYSTEKAVTLSRVIESMLLTIRTLMSVGESIVYIGEKMKS